MKVVVIGARKLLNEDVLAAARGEAQLDLDAATLERCEAEAQRLYSKCNIITGKENSYEFETLDPTIALSEVESRAAIIVRISSLLQCRSGVRSEIPLILVSLLNAGICPLLPIEVEKEGLALIHALAGRGYAYCGSGVKSLSEATDKSTISLLSEMTSTEREVLRLRSFSVAAVVCITAAAAVNALNLADGASTLTLEACRAFNEPFQSTHFDICRQHRGQIDVAERIRLLLTGSKLINSRCLTSNSASKKKSTAKESVSPEKNEVFQDVDALRGVPQYHGPARECILSAYKAAETEINSAEFGPVSLLATNAGPYHMQQMNSAAYQLLHALQILKNGSVARYVALSTGSISVVHSDDIYLSTQFNDSSFESRNQILLALRNSLLDVQNTLSCEISNSISVIYNAEEDIKKEISEKKAILEAKMVTVKEKTDGGETGLTPEQIAKRREKAEQNAALKAKKAAAKGKSTSSLGSVGILGEGTTEIKHKIISMCQAEQPSPEQLLELLDPYDLSDKSLGTAISNIIERLSSGGAKRKPKLPKGTRDQNPGQMLVREQAFEAIRSVFKHHGAVEIDTPVFELKSTLSGKYGEDQKLIYDLADQGGELLALRYDLTVPFARYLAMNNSIGNIKRYHIAKVYRRDQPNLARGRYREFYQCDFDIAGTYGSMVPDAEVLSVACEILEKLPIGDFQVKLNHRRLLDAILDICGCPAEKFRTICSAIDKLDKAPWEEVRKEMVEEKGLAPEAADQIGTFVTFHGPPRDLWNELKSSEKFGDHPDAAVAMQELSILFDYLDAMDTLKFIEFDLSLARGLTYYTGLIYECVVLDGSTKVGSIAAGGRYDNLVGMFSATHTPCVGVSIGIERVFAIMEAREENKGERTNIEVFIAGVGPDLLMYRMKLAKLLWNADISAEFNHQLAPKLKPQLTEVLERGIPFMLIVGEEEFKLNSVRIKDMTARTEDIVQVEDVVRILIEKNCRTIKNSKGLL